MRLKELIINFNIFSDKVLTYAKSDDRMHLANKQMEVNLHEHFYAKS